MQGERSSGGARLEPRSRGEISPAQGRLRASPLGFSPSTRRFPTPGHPSCLALAGTQSPLAPPRPAPPADLSGRPGRGPPGGRTRGRRAPGEPLLRAPPSGRTSFPRKAGPRRAAQVAAGRRASPAPARRRPYPAGRVLAAACPAARPRLQFPDNGAGAGAGGGRENTKHMGCPSAPPGPSALRISNHRAPPHSKSGRRPLPWRPKSRKLTHLCQEGRDTFCSLPLGSS